MFLYSIFEDKFALNGRRQSLFPILSPTFSIYLEMHNYIAKIFLSTAFDHVYKKYVWIGLNSVAPFGDMNVEYLWLPFFVRYMWSSFGFKGENLEKRLISLDDKSTSQFLCLLEISLEIS